MQTIWLQRSSPDIPWGFRLVGGREFGIPLTVQRVTPGGVAAGGLGPGDVILKIGNVMATNLEHNDAQELVRQATNILQLTIKKVEGASPSGPLSPAGPGYGSHMSAQYSDNTGSGTLPRGFGTGIPISSSSSSSGAANYATTPRNYGSQYQPPIQGTRIEIQRERPVQQQSGYRGNVYHDENNDSGGTNFPDYTLAYRNQEPVHDSPGGPASVRGYQPPKENDSYNTKPWPQTSGGYTSNDRDGYWGSGGPPAYEPRSQNANQGSSSPWMSPDTRFNTGLPLQSTPQKPQQPYTSPAPQSYQPTYNSVPAQPTYNSTPGPFSPSQYSVAPNQQTSSTSGFASREPSSPDRQPSFASVKSGFEHPNISGPGSAYSTPPYSNSSFSTNVNSNYNTYNSPQQPQSFSQPQQYVPTQATNRYTPESFSPAQSRPYQSPLSPGSSGYPGPPTSTRKISFDQDVQENGPYTPPNFSGPYRPAPSSYSAPQYDYGAADFGISSPKSGNLSRQSSRHEDSYTAPSYTYGSDVTSARPEPVGYGLGSAGYYDSSGVSEGIDNISLGESHRYEPPPPAPAAPAPPPPPPPPPPGPPPPPAPPLGDWNATPYRRQTSKAGEEAEEQKIPDQILNTMLKSAKGGGPKPFSYGIDLSELKKKIGPPTAPKPRPGQPNYQSEDDDDVQTPRQYVGPPRKPAGHVQSDYFIKRDYDDEPGHRSKKPVGQVQSDYYQTRQTGPRSEIDESPININMGTNPKKQSKSFKVLQWMTETDKDDLEGKTAAAAAAGSRREEEEDDGLPETLSSDDMVDKRYRGGNIPSKVFKVLQKSVGDDTAETPSPPISRPAGGSGQLSAKSAAPVSDF